MLKQSYLLAKSIGLAFTLLYGCVTAWQMNEVSRSSFANRRHFLVVTTTATTSTLLQPVHAFEGGVGGLGKTKPETGVEFLSSPFQSNDGWVSAEVVVQASPFLL
jgi:hypothetical protein